MDTIKYRGFNIEISHSEDPIPPNECEDNINFLVYDHRSFYVKVEGFDPAEIFESTKERQKLFYNGHFVFPVFAYIHSGVSLSLSDNFPDSRWDVSMKGFVLIEKTKGQYFRKKALKIAEAVIEEWNDYLSGNVYSFCVTSPFGDVIDSCSGWYGDYEKSGMLKEAKASINQEIHSKVKRHIKYLKKIIKSKVPLIYRKPLILY